MTHHLQWQPGVLESGRPLFSGGDYANAGNHSLTSRSGENSGRTKITVQKWKQR